ncbi:UNVERIFIED_CONTAM: hypothetical protein H355_001505 [Colinus virginianus]|nr:hypothetical protein H355_001505 [Colinus virginianus]
MGLGQNGAVRVEWIAAVTLAAGAAAVGYLAYKKILSKDKCCKAMVNLHIQKDNPKVVHAFDMEDLGDKAVYCRCWRSKKDVLWLLHMRRAAWEQSGFEPFRTWAVQTG